MVAYSIDVAIVVKFMVTFMLRDSMRTALIGINPNETELVGFFNLHKDPAVQSLILYGKDILLSSKCLGVILDRKCLSSITSRKAQK